MVDRLVELIEEFITEFHEAGLEEGHHFCDICQYIYAIAMNEYVTEKRLERRIDFSELDW